MASGTARDAAKALARDFADFGLEDIELAEICLMGGDWFWETDAEHRFRRISEGFRRCTGHRPEQFIGRSRTAYLRKEAAHDVDAARHLEEIEARQPFRDFVYFLEDRQGRSRMISISGRPLFDAHGEFAGYRGIGRDVSRMMSRMGGPRASDTVPAASDSIAQRLIAGLNAIDDAFCYFDGAGRMLLHNTSLLDMFPMLEDVLVPGVSLHAVVQAAGERGMWADGFEELREALTSSAPQKTATQTELLTADGRWILHRTMPVDDGGQISICTDITANKNRELEVERARQASEQLLEDMKRILDAMHLGVVVLDGNLDTVIVNQAYFKIWNIDPEDVPIGISARGMFEKARECGVYDVPEDEWADYVDARIETLRGGEVAQQEIRRADGGTMIYAVHKLSDDKRLVTYYDVTAMKLREVELDRATQRAEHLRHDLTLTLDTVDLGVVLLDRDLNALMINKAFYDFWGLTPETAPVGASFEAILAANRHNGIYDVPDTEWDAFVRWRLDEIRTGEIAPREFARADGKTCIYGVTPLSDGKRLISYYDVTAMKQREGQLAEALEMSRLAEAVVDSLPNPIFVKDDKLRFVMANKAFADFFGSTPSRMIGKTASSLVGPADAAEFEGTEREVLESGELFEIEEDYKEDDAVRSRLVRKNRVTTGADRNYLACSIFDVTDMKRREMEAVQARRHLANVLESLPAGVIIYDRDNRFVLANNKVQEALPAMVPAMQPGKPLREAVETAHAAGYFRQSGDPELDAIYDSDREAWIDGYMARYDARLRVFERANPDGRWFQAFDTRLEDGTYVGVRVDISELKQREQALRESMDKIELFSHVLDELPVSTYVKDADRRFEFVNKAWCDVSGVTPEEAIGKRDDDFFGADAGAFAERDREVLETGRMSEFEEVVPHRDGTSRFLIARKSRLIGSDGRVHLIGSSADISDLKQREAELEAAQHKAVLADRAKSEFLANMSHEIRTPMNGVLGMAELLSKTQLDQKQKTFTDIIMKSGNALLTIINDILDFSKIDAGQMVLDPAPFNLAEAVEDVATLMTTRAKEKDLEMIVRFQPGLCEHHVGDAGRIRQIVTNLMGNAVKFTDAGHVLLEVTGTETSDGTELRIAVTDTGIGIPENKLAAVFDKFSQVDASSTRRHEGTGLGLAITSKLVDLMGGRIGVDSVEGQGSTFWVELLLPKADVGEAQKVTPIDVTGARILIVDDNQINRSILMEQMASWGFDSCAAKSGVEGIDVLKAATGFGIGVDCIVLDHQMPGMSGLDVAREVRRNDGIRDTPIVLLSSVDQALAPGLGADLGIDVQLTKPARSSALLEALVETIQKRRQQPLSVTRSAVAPAPEPRSVVPAPAEPVAPLEAVAPRLAASDGLHRVDILVAEDNEVNQLVFTQILSETGLTFEIVGNGALAVRAWSEMSPRMILMDVSMPEMNGLEATGRIRETEAGQQSRTPIIGVTAHALKGDRERCIDAGMDDYLSKPISPRLLLEMIDKWIGGEAVSGRLKA
ncbi:PAS domain-containing protein [Chelativorans sp. ZYF759]|uniref:PAS-domain containing protein n=1 Tax=Chelativorans sp. ZYF759 TaxID=2692213 RepID=UPI00145EED99|nr:PAS domain-containing protein [Chelativorans sp. ZYF759]